MSNIWKNKNHPNLKINNNKQIFNVKSNQNPVPVQLLWGWGSSQCFYVSHLYVPVYGLIWGAEHGKGVGIKLSSLRQRRWSSCSLARFTDQTYLMQHDPSPSVSLPFKAVLQAFKSNSQLWVIYRVKYKSASKRRMELESKRNREKEMVREEKRERGSVSPWAVYVGHMHEPERKSGFREKFIAMRILTWSVCRHR